MKFNDELNNYLKELNCNSKDLSNASGLSPATISRYRNTNRVPALNSSHLEQLAIGIHKIAIDNNKSTISKESVLHTLTLALTTNSFNFEQLRKNFNLLVETLEINVAEMARALNFDPSYFSRIRTGKRTPANIESFVDSVCHFITRKYASDKSKEAVAALLNCTIKDLTSQDFYYSKLLTWLNSSSPLSNTVDIDNFLQKLNDFNLNEYIKVIHFDELKVPAVPFYKSFSKTYYGIEKMKQGELDFFKATVLSKSTSDIFMCSDMPMEDMATDINFGKKWMFAIAMSIKKGLHINIIHNIDRPFNEMMLGLESWIPIYMTGQVSPYYFKQSQNTLYCNLNYVSGKVALSGECIKGFHNEGKYHLTSNVEEVNYFKNKADLLLKKASPLMDIYTSTNKIEFDKFLINYSKSVGNRTRFLTVLPLHTISEELLVQILKRNSFTEQEITQISKNILKQKELINNILENNSIHDNIPKLSENDFNISTFNISLSTFFGDKQIPYTYEEYLQHLQLTEDFSYQNSNYTFEINSQNTFNNIEITIQKDTSILISKNTDPAIHFVIKHPKLQNAIENFVAPIIEK